MNLVAAVAKDQAPRGPKREIRWNGADALRLKCMFRYSVQMAESRFIDSPGRICQVFKRSFTV
jgi:hypothetical protein